jgi:hypothetical protein
LSFTWQVLGGLALACLCGALGEPSYAKMDVRFWYGGVLDGLKGHPDAGSGAHRSVVLKLSLLACKDDSRPGNVIANIKHEALSKGHQGFDNAELKSMWRRHPVDHVGKVRTPRSKQSSFRALRRRKLKACTKCKRLSCFRELDRASVACVV